MSKQVNIDFVTRQIEVDTDGKEHFISAAMAAKDAEQSMISAQNAASSVQKYKALWFDSVAAMKAEPSLTAGAYVCTAGYYTPNDGGGASYLIRAKTDADIDDGGSLHELANGLVAELIVENGTVNVKQLGANGDANYKGNTGEDLSVILDSLDDCILYFPRGIYHTTKAIDLNKFKIIGDNAMILLTSDEIIDNFLYYSTNYNSNKSELLLRGVVIDGNGKCKNGIKLSGIANEHLSNITILNAIEKNIFVESGYEMFVKDVFIDNKLSVSENPNVIGIYCDTSDCSFKSIIIKNNTIGYYQTQRTNTIDDIHVWINQTERMQGSIGFKSQDYMLLSNCYTDTVNIGFIATYASLLNCKYYAPSDNSIVDNYVFNVAGNVSCIGCIFYKTSGISVEMNINTRVALDNCLNNINDYVQVTPVNFKFYKVEVKTTLQAKGTIRIQRTLNGLKYGTPIFMSYNENFLGIGSIAKAYASADNELSIFLENNQDKEMTYNSSVIVAIPTIYNNSNISYSLLSE